MAPGCTCRGSCTGQRSSRRPIVEDGWLWTHQIQSVAVPGSGQASLASFHRDRTHNDGLRSLCRVCRAGHEAHDCDDKREPYGIRPVGNIHARFDRGLRSCVPDVCSRTGCRNALPDVRLHPRTYWDPQHKRAARPSRKDADNHSPSHPSLDGRNGGPRIRELHQRIPSHPGSAERKLSVRIRDTRTGSDSRLLLLDAETNSHDPCRGSEERDTTALATHSYRIPGSATGLRNLPRAIARKRDQTNCRPLTGCTLSGGEIDHKPLGPDPISHTCNIRITRHSSRSDQARKEPRRGCALRRLDRTCHCAWLHNLVGLLWRTFPDLRRVPSRPLHVFLHRSSSSRLAVCRDIIS